MQQQLIEQTIEITPQTMNDVLPKIVHTLNQHCSQQVMENIVKSIFYGLWNFDKMINQHNLSTAIAQMLHKLPKKTAFVFLSSMLSFLASKWNLIDHHRINKFMQLTRYLIKQSMKISQKKTDEVLMQTVFRDISQRSGIADHVTELYFNTACQVFLHHQHKNQTLPVSRLQIFQNLLRLPSSLEYFRLHIIEKIYQKYKSHIIQTTHHESEEGKAQLIIKKIQALNQHFIELAKSEEDDKIRKNIYTLVGFMKSDHSLFSLYSSQKQQKMQAQKQKKKKKITKFKKQIIRQQKNKRKQKNKQNKKSKIISRSKFEFRARQQMNKFMEE